MTPASDSNPKIVESVDVTKIGNSARAKNPAAVPTIIIRPEGQTGDQNQGKVKLLEKIIKTEILLNIFLVLILFVSLYISFVMRFDILKYFSKNAVSNTGSDQQAGSIDPNFRVVAAEPSSTQESVQVVYITGQGLDLDKAFQASSPGRLTVFGKMNSEVMGFLPYWVVPRIDSLDLGAITSISYFGLEVDGSGEVIKNDAGGKPIEGWTYLQKDKNLENFFKKARNSKLKVYLTLKSFNQDNIVALTTSEKARTQFIASALQLMESKSFDGLNIDFEYIGTPRKEVRDGFSALIINLYKTMKSQHPNSKLTIDTFVDAAAANRIHDIPVLAQNSDGLVIMGYDFHTPNSSVPGPVAPMEGGGLSIKGLMASYLEKAPADKLILAVPYYGYDWPVKQIGSGFVADGSRQQVNVVAYGELAAATGILWDENAQSPWYSYQDTNKQNRVVYFENVRSLSIKYDYIKQNKLQGVAIWALGFDGSRTELEQTLIDKFAD